MDTCLDLGDDGDTCLGAADDDTCLDGGDVGDTCLGAAESSLTLSLSRLSLCSLTMVSMGTPTPMSRLSGSKSGGGSTGSRYGASKSSMGRQGLSKPSLSGVAPPLSTSRESSASQTWDRENGISGKMVRNVCWINRAFY